MPKRTFQPNRRRRRRTHQGKAGLRPRRLPGAAGHAPDTARPAEAERVLRLLPSGCSWISHAGEIIFTARLAGNEPALRALLLTDTISEFMKATVGPAVRLYFDQAVYKKPRCNQVVPWHQDNGYNPKVPADYVTFWVPVTDTTVANGTEILERRGSKRAGVWKSVTAVVIPPSSEVGDGRLCDL